MSGFDPTRFAYIQPWLAARSIRGQSSLGFQDIFQMTMSERLSHEQLEGTK